VFTTTSGSSHHGDETAGVNVVHVDHAHHAAHAAHALEVGVLAAPQEHLVARVVGAVVEHEAAALHLAGAAPAQVGGEVGAVAAAVVGATLEVLVLVEGDLRGRGHAEG